MRRFFPVALLVAALAGCSTGPVLPPSTGDWNQRQQQLLRLDHWQVQGKVGIRQADAYNSATLSWTQRPETYRIFLAGPLGQGAVDIQGTPSGVTLNIAGEGSYQAQTPEALLYQQLGWYLPISELHYWVRGLPAPGAPDRHTLDARQRLQTLEQLGWTIQYRDYHDDGAPDLPRRLVLTRGDDLKVTLVLKEWSLSSPSL